MAERSSSMTISRASSPPSPAISAAPGRVSSSGRSPRLDCAWISRCAAWTSGSPLVSRKIIRHAYGCDSTYANQASSALGIRVSGGSAAVRCAAHTERISARWRSSRRAWRSALDSKWS